MKTGRTCWSYKPYSATSKCSRRRTTRDRVLLGLWRPSIVVIPWEASMKSPNKIKPPSSKTGRSKKQGIRLTKKELVLQPWFLPKRVARIVWGLVPADYRKRLHDYFDDYGCMRCSRLDVSYKSNAMCRSCYMKVFNRLQQSIARRSGDRLPRGYGREIVRKAAQARKLLAEFSRKNSTSSRGRRFRSVRLSSPIVETY
jgi:hypothetical protein